MPDTRNEYSILPYQVQKQIWWQIFGYLPHAKIHEVKFYSRFFYHLASEFLDPQEYFPAQHKKILTYDEHIFLLNETGQLFHWSLSEGLINNQEAKNFSHIQSLPCIVDFYVGNDRLFVATDKGQVLRLDGALSEVRAASFVVDENAPENVQKVMVAIGLVAYLTQDQHVYFDNGKVFKFPTTEALYAYGKSIYLISSCRRLYLAHPNHNDAEVVRIQKVTDVERMTFTQKAIYIHPKEGQLLKLVGNYSLLN